MMLVLAFILLLPYTVQFTSKIIPMVNLVNYSSKTTLNNATLGDCFSACVKNDSNSRDCVGVYYFYTNNSCQLISSIQNAQCSGEPVSKNKAMLYVRVNLITNNFTTVDSCTPNKTTLMNAVPAVIKAANIRNCSSFSSGATLNG